MNTPGPGDRATLGPFITDPQDPDFEEHGEVCIDCDNGLVPALVDGEWELSRCPVCDGTGIAEVNNMGRRRR